MNQYLKNLTKLEFIVSYACTGKCKHCSEGDHSLRGERIDPKIAAETVKKVAAAYPLKTVMTFGGEPLLYPEAVYAIHEAATEMGVPKRQLITNGYFTKDAAQIVAVAEGLAKSGVNDVLLSVDAFHQETIPLSPVKAFARAVAERKVPLRIQPAWLLSPTDENLYNIKTRELIAVFADMGVKIGEGNVIFPEGNALKYLKEYFRSASVENPYVEDPKDVKCLSVEPDGSVLGGNIYREDIMKIIENYKP